jgi:hypothetical protein
MSFNILIIDSDYIQEKLIRDHFAKVDPEGYFKIKRVDNTQEADKILNSESKLSKFNVILFACTAINSREEKISGVDYLKKYAKKLQDKDILVFALSYHFGIPVKEINDMGIGIINLIGTSLSPSLGFA